MCHQHAELLTPVAAWRPAMLSRHILPARQLPVSRRLLSRHILARPVVCVVFCLSWRIWAIICPQQEGIVFAHIQRQCLCSLYTNSENAWEAARVVGSHTHTHTHLTALCPGLPRWAGTRKVKPIWILLKQETVSGSGISCAICKSAPRSRQTYMPAPHHSVF